MVSCVKFWVLDNGIPTFQINGTCVKFGVLDNGISAFQGSGMPSSFKVKMSDVELLYLSTIDDDAVVSHNIIWLPSNIVSYPRLIES